MPPAAPLNDLGITDADERAALIAQGYSTDEADEFMADPYAGPVMPGPAVGYRSENVQDLAPTDTPESLRAAGYEIDPTTNNWFRVIGSEQMPAAPGAADQRSGGHRLALEQEQANRALLGDMGETSFTDQLTAPINDELEWLAGYAGQAVGNAGRLLTGQDIEVGAIDRARALRDISLQQQEAYQTEKPVEALAGGLLGGFAFAPARAAAVPGLIGRLGQAGGVSAAYGAADGEGVGGRIGSALATGALGVATAGLLEGAAPLSRSVMRGVQRRRIPAADRAARDERRVSGAVSRTLERDAMEPQALLDSMQNGPSVQMPFQAGGENLVGLTETMANAPGNARRQIVSAIQGQQNGSNNRVAANLSDEFGAQGNGFQAIRQRVAARGEEANAGMAAIAGTTVPLDDRSVQAFRAGLSSRAVRDAAEEAVADMSPEGAAAANRLFGLGDQVLDNPGAAQITVREAQDISYALKEAASVAYRAGRNTRGEALQNLSTAIRQNARDTVPPYDAWLRSFGDASEAIDSQRAGMSIFNTANEKNALSAAELADRWTNWSANARESYRLGVGEAVLNRVRGNGGVAAMRRLLRDDELAGRVRVAFDTEDAFIRFMQSADDEVRMQGLNNQVLAGSPTVRRAAGQADLQQQGLGPMDAVEFLTDIGSPVAMGRKALGLLAKNLPRADRSILGNERLNGLLGEALTDPAAMTRLLNLIQTDQALNARVTAQLRSMGLLSSPAAANEGQQQIRGLLTASP